jgi:hypothetical protein
LLDVPTEARENVSEMLASAIRFNWTVGKVVVWPPILRPPQLQAGSQAQIKSELD